MTSKDSSETNFRLKYDNSVNPIVPKLKMDTSQQFTKMKKKLQTVSDGLLSYSPIEVRTSLRKVSTNC